MKKIYRINGIEYNSLDEIPLEFKKMITSDLIEKLEKNHPESFQTTIVSPVSENTLEFKSMKWILYFASQAISLAENQVMRNVALLLNLVDTNTFLSLLFSFIIGQISFSLAQRYYLKQTENLNIKYSGNLGFFEKFTVSQISGAYSFVLNLIFFLILILTKYIRIQEYF